MLLNLKSKTIKTISMTKQVKKERNAFFLVSSTSFASPVSEGPSTLLSTSASDLPENQDIRKAWMKVS